MFESACFARFIIGPSDYLVRFRPHLGHADVARARRGRVFGREPFPHDALMRLAGHRRCGDLARLMGTLAAPLRAIDRIRAPANHEAPAAGCALRLARHGTRGTCPPLPMGAAARRRAILGVAARLLGKRAHTVETMAADDLHGQKFVTSKINEFATVAQTASNDPRALPALGCASAPLSRLLGSSARRRAASPPSNRFAALSLA